MRALLEGLRRHRQVVVAELSQSLPSLNDSSNHRKD